MKELKEAKIISIEKFHSGKRALLDFMNEFSSEDCIMVGNTANGFFLLPSENRNSPDYLPRKFRFNAGAINQYISTVNGVKYIDELTAGDMINIYNKGKINAIPLARIKIEIRNFVRIVAQRDNEIFNVILQDGNTSALFSQSDIKYVSQFSVNDNVTICVNNKASHLGKLIDEYCEEK